MKELIHSTDMLQTVPNGLHYDAVVLLLMYAKLRTAATDPRIG